MLLNFFGTHLSWAHLLNGEIINLYNNTIVVEIDAFCEKELARQEDSVVVRYRVADDFVVAIEAVPAVLSAGEAVFE